MRIERLDSHYNNHFRPGSLMQIVYRSPAKSGKWVAGKTRDHRFNAFAGVQVILHNGTEFGGRRRIPGPETQLVDRFISSFRPHTPASWRLTLFIEPRVGHRFPDIVAVFWHLATVENWPDIRANITLKDLRISQLLHSNGPTSTDDLSYLCGDDIDSHLIRLLDANIIINRGKIWRLRSLRKIFAVRRILAFEAKTTASANGIGQALANLWFASSSFLLVPQVLPTSQVIQSAIRSGLGVWFDGASRPLQGAHTIYAQQPASYASWFFNEWCWRLSRSTSLFST